jgi:uncharacterized protein (DUF2164 family)
MKKRTELSLLSKDQRLSLIGEIVGFFENERDEEIGVIAAEEVLEFLLEKVGGAIYNKGVRDTKKLIRSRMEDFDVDIEALIV